MKKIRTKLIVGFLLFVMAMPANAADKKDSKKAATPEQVKQMEAYNKQKSKIQELDGSEWAVTVVSTDGKTKSSEEDKLIFNARTVSLKSFEKKGYRAVGYTVTPDQDGEGAAWENYQETKDGSLSMYGHWKKDSMTGSVRERDEKGKKTYAYSFSSSRKISLKSEEANPATVAETAPLEAGKALVSIEQTEKKPDQKS